MIRWYEAAPKSTFRRSVGDCAKAPCRPPTTTPRGRRWPRTTPGTLFLSYARAGLTRVPRDLGGDRARRLARPRPRRSSGRGSSRYEFGPGVERWGDFSAANRDPVTPADVAVFGAFAEDTGGATTDAFREHVALLADT